MTDGEGRNRRHFSVGHRSAQVIDELLRSSDKGGGMAARVVENNNIQVRK